MTDWECMTSSDATWKRGYTNDEIAEAEKLYKAQVTDMYARGYAGDFGTSLQFAMDTYAPFCWQHFFKRPPPQ